MQRFLVIRGGAIGDFVLTIPVFSAIRRSRPDAHIGLVGYPRVKRLTLECGIADTFRSLDSAELAPLFSENCELDVETEKYLQSFDTVISYLPDPDGVLRETFPAGSLILTAASVTREPSTVNRRAPREQRLHAADQFGSVLAKLGVPFKTPAVPRLELPASSIARERERLGSGARNTVVIHPGSGGTAKRWPADQFAGLANTLEKQGRLKPVFLFGEADAAAQNELTRLAPGIRSFDSLDLLEVSGLLAACAGYVGNDSGITHLAAAIGTRTIAVFGPTDPEIWGPRGSNVRIVRGTGPGAAEIVLKAISE